MAAQPPAAAKPSLTLERRFDAAPERVFQAWTDPAHISRWWGPGDSEVLEAATDLRVGGRFHVAFRGGDGERHDVSGIYREVEANRKLVFTWAWRTLPERESLVTVLVRPEGGGTRLTLIHEQFFDEAARDRHEFGWNSALDKLQRLFGRAEREEPE
jgi:uncharacterized protein YndB with AHSA1/START domain